ncbi:MAG: hypothetical protein HZA28_02605 [Candidatus Omnitrophica bacterium]|nr:hypothetical protein [Candidatus Omnitrophota bacterium]
MVILSSCGYTTRSTLPSDFKTVHIQTFKNSISFAAEGRRNLYLPLLEVKVKNAIASRFLFDGNLKIADEDKADLVLKGELLSYDRTALRYTDNDDVQEYRIHITVFLELWNTRKQGPAWTEPGFVGEATYFTTGAQAKSEESTVDDAITDLARRIVERTVEDW